MSFIESLERNLNVAYTENGAISNNTSLDYVLDFFAKGGALRSNTQQAVELFKKAYAQDKQLAVRALFYLRDIRGGQGEREVFRACLKSLEDSEHDTLLTVLKYVSEFGRWDDLFVLKNKKVLQEISNIVKQQLEADHENMLQNKSISLLAKWLPSNNASSKESRKKALALGNLLNLTERNYRKKLAELKKYIKLLESQMSSKKWNDINYETIPSQAHRKHVKAFYRHDEERYTKYLESVKKGEKKINTNTLYAYEVYNMVMNGDTEVADAMWQNLPDHTRGENALVMADVSGSMSGLPMSVSVSLALYFADKNEGDFKNYFMTFSGNPTLQKITGNTLTQKMNCIQSADWGMNTDLESAFVAILNSAIKNNTPASEMPKILYIISDMQFDSCVTADKTLFRSVKEQFSSHGYELPHVVFWNVRGSDTSPVTKYDNNVTLVSGCSQSTFKYAVDGKSPLQFMSDVLNSERYACISL